MIDRRAREALQPALTALARPLDRWGLGPTAVTVAGLVVGVGACAAAALAAWPVALALWLLNRLADGVDGALARLQTGGGGARGGYVDLMADFAVYGGFVAGCAVGQPTARLACLVLLLAYYLNGAALLAHAALTRGPEGSDDRSVVFLGGLAEGAETVVVHALMVVVPSQMAPIAWAFAVLVAITVVQRVTWTVRTLG